MSGRVLSNFDRLGGEFSNRDWVRDGEFAKRLSRVVDQLPSGRWLELGSGAGDFSDILVRPHSRLFGVDLSVNMLHAAKVSGRPVVLICADASRLPLADGCVSVIASRNLLKHCSEPLASVREMVRVGERGAWIVVVETCAVDEADREFMNGLIAISEPHQSGFLMPQEWLGVLSRAGIAVRRQLTFTTQVVSTPAFRRDHYGMDPATMLAHWSYFEKASETTREVRCVEQSDEGLLRFLLFWTAMIGHI
jgi:SAM-dependent methyltransferase